MSSGFDQQDRSRSLAWSHGIEDFHPLWVRFFSFTGGVQSQQGIVIRGSWCENVDEVVQLVVRQSCPSGLGLIFFEI